MYKITKKRLLNAKERRMNRQHRRSDTEYMQCIYEEYCKCARIIKRVVCYNK